MQRSSVREQNYFSESPPIDQVGVEERVSRFTKRSIKKESKVFALKLAMSMIDLTTLEARDTPGKVIQLCNKAMHPHDAVAMSLHIPERSEVEQTFERVLSEIAHEVWQDTSPRPCAKHLPVAIAEDRLPR